MKYYIFTTLLGMVGAFKSMSKDKHLSPYKPMPAITNSLVNLGKMDVSFYINAKEHDKPTRKVAEPSLPFSSLFIPKISDEPCPCSMMKNLKDTLSSSPHNLVNKILTSNDLFSVKNPMLSPLCCDSHVDAMEAANMFFEFGSKPGHSLFDTEMAFPVPSFDSLLSRSPAELSSKPKTIEIVFLPKKPFEKAHSKKVQSNKDIAIVGKEAKAERFEKAVSAFTPSSVDFKSSVIEEDKKEMKEMKDFKEIKEITELKKVKEMKEPKEEKPNSAEDLNKAAQVPVKDSNSLIK